MPEKKSQTQKQRINPAQFISKKEQPITKKARQKKQTPKTSPKKPKKPVKKKKTTKNVKPTHKAIESLKSLQTDIKLPKPDNALLEALATLPEAVQSKPSLSLQEKMLKEIYGDDYTRISTTSKQYLLDNHLKMQMITQRVLNRIGQVYLDPRFRYYNYNTIEFMFYPDGHIGPITILKDAGFQLLDKITKETIETAYKDYPRPTEPTLVRYRFLYDLRS